VKAGISAPRSTNPPVSTSVRSFFAFRVDNGDFCPLGPLQVPSVPGGPSDALSPPDYTPRAPHLCFQENPPRASPLLSSRRVAFEARFCAFWASLRRLPSPVTDLVSLTAFHELACVWLPGHGVLSRNLFFPGPRLGHLFRGLVPPLKIPVCPGFMDSLFPPLSGDWIFSLVSFSHPPGPLPGVRRAVDQPSRSST